MLETALGAKLFDRTTRKLTLTEVGQVVCEHARQTGDVWDQALGRIEDLHVHPAFRLSVPSSLAMKWLVPALGRAAGQGLELTVDVDDDLVDLRASSARAAIRYGPGPYPGFFSELLSRAEIVPVAKPGTVPGSMRKAVKRAQEHRFLGDTAGETDGTEYSWSAYCGDLEEPMDVPGVSQSFGRADLMLQAAIGGMGIALGRTLLIEGDVETGLLEVVGAPVMARSRYWLVTTPETAATQGYQILKTWLLEEVSRSKMVFDRPFGREPNKQNI